MGNSTGEKKQIARAAGSMASATVLSRVLGFVRDMTLAFFFGASGLTDSFFVAFKIPNMLREIFAEGSMSSAVIPVLTGYEKDDPEEGRTLLRVLIGFGLVGVGAICVLAAVFAPAIVSAIAGGFLKTPEKFEATVLMARIMMPFLLFVSLASVLMAALNTRRKFFLPALSPAVFNLTLVISVYLLATRLEQPILAAAIGVCIGGLMQVLFQVPATVGQGFSLTPSLAFRHPGFRRIITLVLPVTVGMAVSQINIVVGNFIASFLPEGSITYLFYSMRLIQFPIGVFGVAMGMAVLPSLSSHAHAGDMKSLREDFSFALRALMFISIPSMAGLIALRTPIVATLFQHGSFTGSDTAGTAEALLYYSLGIWAVAGVKVLASTFYSLKDTRTPVKAAVVALFINIAMSLVLMGPMKHSGLALAQAISAMVNFSLLFILLRKTLGRMGAKAILISLLKSAIAAFVMGAALMTASGMPIWATEGQTLQKAALLAALIAAGSGIYAVAALALKCNETDFVLKLLKRKFKRETA